MPVFGKMYITYVEGSDDLKTETYGKNENHAASMHILNNNLEPGTPIVVCRLDGSYVGTYKIHDYPEFTVKT